MALAYFLFEVVFKTRKVEIRLKKIEENDLTLEEFVSYLDNDHKQLLWEYFYALKESLSQEENVNKIV